MKKYLPLCWAMIKGLILIGVVAWLVLQFRDNFVYGKAVVSWGAYTALAGAAFGMAFAGAARICRPEIKKLQGK
jgi:hypothetical protein